MRLNDIANQTGNQIFHCQSWDVVINEELINDLVNEARKNQKNKARLCLHPSPEEQMQVTYLAFVAPYEDAIHCHPHRPEVLVPIRGIAESRIYDVNGKILSVAAMKSGAGSSFCTDKGQWHALKLVSSEFVMLEIGSGPFSSSSTIFLG
jgi:cupin fold WbuC family metalloprotein